MAPAAKSSPNPVVTTLHLHHISPSFPDTSPPTHDLTFPLTYFDLLWLRTPPVERLLFYPLPPETSTAAFFTSVLLPTLSRSLSAALSHFLPLAATLTWPSHSAKPFLLYSPSSSPAVPLTVAQSAADFNHLASPVDQTRLAVDSHPYVPALPSSDTTASVVALQITLFPDQGFCVGISTHHAVLDGKSAALFLKAWAHLSRTSNSNNPTLLPEELTPFLDRSIVHDPKDLGRAYLNFWTGFTNSGPRSLKLAPPFFAFASGLVRATFLLSDERIQKLREKVESETTKTTLCKIRLSSFVVAFAHSLRCAVKAKRLHDDDDREAKAVVHFAFPADARGRMKPRLPENYLGNCVFGLHDLIEVKPLLAEGGMGFAAEKVSKMIDDMEEKAGGEEDMSRFMSNMEASRGVSIGVAGSPRFHVYGADFGWGKPEYVEVTSIDRTGAISVAECRDGSRGIEVGLALTVDQMEVFRSAFAA